MKLRKKLLLSCAALAACATTLVSTTFAWYTSNSDVTASGIQGTTADAGADLLLISDTGAVGSWSNSVAIADTYAVATDMKPVAYVANTNAKGTLKGWGAHAVANSAAAATEYITFDIYLKASSAVEVYLEEFNIVPESDTLPTKPILANAGGLASTDSVTTYTVDARRTLQMEVFSEYFVDDVELTNEQDNQKTDFVNLFDLDGLFTPTTDSLTGKDLGPNAEVEGVLANTKANAHEYYNKVLGQDIATDAPAAAPKTLGTSGEDYLVCTTPVGTNAAKQSYVKLTFTIFMNGWDYACFDACQGQGFSVNLKFTCETTGKTIIKAAANA